MSGGPSIAMVRRVPMDYATIQAALDATLDGDTVLVALGTYTEALRAPSFRFVLRGDVVPDTGDYPRPLIDPVGLIRRDTLACLILPAGSRVRIEDFAFRNGAAMYDDTLDVLRAGGVINSADSLWVERCLFDSVFGGIWEGRFISVLNSQFIDCIQGAVVYATGPTHIENCDFHGRWSFYLVTLRSHSTIRHCTLRTERGYLLHAFEDSVLVENCHFGPTGPFLWDVVHVYAISGTVIQNNVFTDMQLGNAVIHVDKDCSTPYDLPVVIRNNVFSNYRGGVGVGGTAIAFMCQGGEWGDFGLAENNLFLHGQAYDSGGYASYSRAIEAFGGARVEGNRFVDLNPPTVPYFFAGHMQEGFHDTLYLRDNLIDTAGLATATLRAAIDARWNWWGDSSGPYHATQNPGGSGAEITGNVQFIPWHTDTTFVSDMPEPEVPLPQSAVTVYPNPFNSRTTLAFELARAGNVKVVVYDVVGRQVEVLLDGPQPPGRHVLTFGNDSLPSGLYFCHLSAGPARATAKLVLLR